MKKIWQAAAIAAAALALVSCNTIQGVGRDITRAGEFLEDITS
ncbi:MAG: entericidin EcnA/B family protein [Glycocaulis sp.]